MRDMRRRCGPPPLLQPFISRVPGSSTQLLRLLSAFSGVIGTPSFCGLWLVSALPCDSLQGSITGPATHCRDTSPDLHCTHFSPQCQQTRPFILIYLYCNGFLPRGINLPLVSSLRHGGVLLHTGVVACSQLSNSGSSPLLP